MSSMVYFSFYPYTFQLHTALSPNRFLHYYFSSDFIGENKVDHP